MKFWEEYFSYWDDFVGNWCQTNGSFDERFRRVFNEKSYDLKEIPEPYIYKTDCSCRVDGVKAIMININPGASSGIECTKCFCRYAISPPSAMLLGKLLGECNQSYRSWVSEYGCLLNEYKRFRSCIPGVKWWQGEKKEEGRGGRMRWINQFYGQFRQGPILPENVFALELCPYHSKHAPTNVFTRPWKGFAEELYLKFVWQHVCKPAVIAACENNVSCIVCVGKEVMDTVEKCLGLDETEPIMDLSEKSKTDGWPKSQKGGKPVCRHYKLWEFSHARRSRWADICKTMRNKPSKVWILGVWTQGSTKLPSKKFSGVEGLIVEKIKEGVNKARRKTGNSVCLVRPRCAISS